MELFELVKKHLKKIIGVDDLLFPLYFDEPVKIEKSSLELEEKGFTIKEFLSTVSHLAQKALIENDDEILRILFSEAPLGLSIDYHKALPNCCWDIPLLFRTDESISGKIYEVQAPGSGWGDLYLYALCYKELGINVPSRLLSFPDIYAKNIMEATNKETPKVFHMTDAASVPYSVRYLINITKKIKYWGYSSDVSMHDIDCLVSHSVVSIVASNYFVDYLQMAKEGKLLFALPPNLIFDEKAIYLLPFYRKTRDLFSDKVRSLFPFTSIIENNGFYDKDGVFITIDKFVSRAPKDRKYYLKYGGPDTNRNWGSRSVYRLSGNDCGILLRNAMEKAKEGEIWLIQEDESKTTSAVSISNDLGNLIFSKRLNIKLSCFYGKDDLPMGIKVMGRHHFKVHGQKDTYVGLGIW